MPVALSTKSNNMDVIINAIRELQQGKDNACGIVTLAANAASTVVNTPLANPTNAVFLYPLSASAAAAMANSPLSAVVTSDFSVTSSTALANIPGLSLNLAAGATYNFESVLFIKSGATAGGMKTAMAGTVTATDIVYDGWALDTGGTPVHGYTLATALGTAVSESNTTSATSTITMRGTITVNAAGTLVVQGAQSASNATATVFGRGSYLNVNQPFGNSATYISNVTYGSFTIAHPNAPQVDRTFFWTMRGG